MDKEIDLIAFAIALAIEIAFPVKRANVRPCFGKGNSPITHLWATPR